MTFVVPGVTWSRTVLPKAVSWPAQPTGLVSVSQSGIVQTRTTTQAGVTWEEIYPPLKPDTIAAHAAFYAQVENYYRNQTRFYIDHRSQRGLFGSAGGTPLVNGAGQTGTSLVTNGWPASQSGVLLPGDVFTLAGMPLVYTVMVQAASDSGGNATLTLNPPLIGNASTSAPADNAALTLNTTPGSVLYAAVLTSVTWPRAQGPGWYQGMTLKFRETNGG